MNLKVIYTIIWQEVEPEAWKPETISNMKFIDMMQLLTWASFQDKCVVC